MIEELKRCRVWVAYTLMWILNFSYLWYLETVMKDTISGVIEMNQSKDFIQSIHSLALQSTNVFPYSIFYFFILLLLVISRSIYKNHIHHQFFYVLIEICLGFEILKHISFCSTSILFLILADSLMCVDKEKYRNLFLISMLGLLFVANYGFLSGIFPMISFSEYLSVYNANTQSILSGIETTLSNLSLVLFIVFMILYLQQQMDETQKFAALNNELKRLNVQLKGYANLREKMGETKERNRLAREIHDTLGHTLTGLSVGLEACKVMIDQNPEATKNQLSILQESASRGLTDVRRSVDKLKPDALERYSLKEALDMLIVDYQKMTDVTVLYLCHLPLVDLNADEEDMVYRVVQEGMTNAVRHGHATKIYVSIAQIDENLIVIVEDNGSGCKEIKPGFGLDHLTERIQMLHGKIRYYGSDGFELIVEMPVRGR